MFAGSIPVRLLGLNLGLLSAAYLEDHADMTAIRPRMLKAVEQVYTVLAACGISCRDLAQDDNLVSGRLCVV